MTNYAYLRVSTDLQELENQKLGVLEYCNNKKIAPLQIIEDTESGKVAWRKRAIGLILNQSKDGDIIVTSEISRLGRSTLQVLEILEVAVQKKVSIHITKNNIIMDGSLQSTITATILGLAAQIEREFISIRTKEALAKCKAAGIKLGRPKGVATNLKLDNHKDLIMNYLKKGVSKRSIARIVECSPSTFYSWIKRRHIYL